MTALRVLVAAALDSDWLGHIAVPTTAQINAVLHLFFSAPFLQMPVTYQISKQRHAPGLEVFPAQQLWVYGGDVYHELCALTSQTIGRRFNAGLAISLPCVAHRRPLIFR